MVKKAVYSLLLASLLCGGCGYTSKTVLPHNIRTLYVAPVQNAINLSNEISDDERLKIYRPGIEVELTNAIINRFIFDGNLKIGKPGRSDATLEAKILDYYREPLRYSDGDDVKEYRISIVADIAVVKSDDRKVIWHEPSLTGDTTFFLEGARSITEDEAASKAVEDLARRVIEKTIELW